MDIEIDKLSIYEDIKNKESKELLVKYLNGDMKEEELDDSELLLENKTFILRIGDKHYKFYGENNCVVCMNLIKNHNVCLFSCLHFSCNKCYKKLQNKCPVCKQDIDSTENDFKSEVDFSIDRDNTIRNEVSLNTRDNSSDEAEINILLSQDTSLSSYFSSIPVSRSPKRRSPAKKSYKGRCSPKKTKYQERRGVSPKRRSPWFRRREEKRKSPS
jgi:hypothetical protein